MHFSTAGEENGTYGIILGFGGLALEGNERMCRIEKGRRREVTGKAKEKRNGDDKGRAVTGKVYKGGEVTGKAKKRECEGKGKEKGNYVMEKLKEGKRLGKVKEEMGRR